MRRKELNLFLNLPQRIELFFLKMTQRIDFFFDMIQRIELFWNDS